MKTTDGQYIVDFSQTAFAKQNLSVYRHWRRLHRQQRNFLIAAILLFLFIYGGYKFRRSNWPSSVPHEKYQVEIELDKKSRQKIIIDSLKSKPTTFRFSEYNDAREWIKKSFNVDSSSVDKFNSHFEITIRILGGLLSAYHLSEDPIFLQRATELGDRLLVNFDTPSGLPLSEININRKTASGYHWTSDASTSEVGTVQLEMRDLSRCTGDKKYEIAADKSSSVLHRASKTDGLVPIFINPTSGLFSGGVISFGARGDSYYEYLLKQWLQTGRTRQTFWQDWIECVDGVQKHLWRHSYPQHHWFVGELFSLSSFNPKMDHLACFLAGNLALGWHFHHNLTYLLEMAKNLTATCYEMYRKPETGLSPEITYFNIDPSSTVDLIIHDNDAKNLLRPELIESLYYMYHLTKDKKYQEWGWKIFESFENYTRVQNGGYTTIDDVVHKDNVKPRDKMESFFLAETLKYFYLLFDDTNLFPFDKWIFNTEAHPLPIYDS